MKVFKIIVGVLSALYALNTFVWLAGAPGLMQRAATSGGEPRYVYAAIAWNIVSGILTALLAFVIGRGMLKPQAKR